MMFSDNLFKDKTVLLTGGSRGIGRATVELLGNLGAEIFFVYKNNKKLAEEIVQNAKNNNRKITGIQLDITDHNKCQELIDSIISKHKKIDILINNSGITRDNLLMGMENSDITDVFSTNISGVFNITKSVIPYMMRNRSGVIINMSSVSAEKGGRGQTNYAASKGAINAFTKSLAVELAPRNIRVNAIAPGIIKTDMSRDVRELGYDEALSKVLLKKFGKPEDIANAVAFLASPMAGYINGAILAVDGGFKMG